MAKNKPTLFYSYDDKNITEMRPNAGVSHIAIGAKIDFSYFQSLEQHAKGQVFLARCDFLYYVL